MPARRTSASAGGYPLGAYLGLFAGCLTAAALLIGSYLIERFAEAERRDAAVSLSAMAGSTISRFEREVSNTLVMLRSWAASDVLDEARLGAFHGWANRMLEGSGAHALVIDRNSRVLLHTRVPYTGPLGPSADPETPQIVFRTGEPTVSGVFYGKVSEEHVFDVLYPVIRDGEVRYVLSITRSATSMLREIVAAGALAQAQVWLTDGAGVVVSQSDDPGASGSTLAPELAAAMVGDRMLSLVQKASGERVYVSHLQSPLTGWSVGVAVPQAVIDGPVEGAWRLLVLLGTLLLGGVVVLVVVLWWLTAMPLRRLSGHARAYGAGETVPPLNSLLREANQVSAALRQASVDRARHEEDLKVVSRELAHRTRNVLAVVGSLASMTARSSASLAEFSQSFEPRLGALATAFDAAARRNWGPVGLREALETTLRPFEQDEGGRFHMAGPGLTLTSGAAEQLGLAVFELATNAVKYGALSVPGGRVHVRWSVDEPAGELNLSWKEEGGPPVTEPAQTGFGHRLVTSTVATKLSGRAEITFAPEGVAWVLRCPLARCASPDDATGPGGPRAGG